MIEEPVFYCVYTFSAYRERFLVAGIFTKETDAEAFRDDLKAKLPEGERNGVVDKVLRHSSTELKYRLIGECTPDEVILALKEQIQNLKP